MPTLITIYIHFYLGYIFKRHYFNIKLKYFYINNVYIADIQSFYINGLLLIFLLFYSE